MDVSVWVEDRPAVLLAIGDEVTLGRDPGPGQNEEDDDDEEDEADDNEEEEEEEEEVGPCLSTERD